MGCKETGVLIFSFHIPSVMSPKIARTENKLTYYSYSVAVHCKIKLITECYRITTESRKNVWLCHDFAMCDFHRLELTSSEKIAGLVLSTPPIAQIPAGHPFVSMAFKIY